MTEVLDKLRARKAGAALLLLAAGSGVGLAAAAVGAEVYLRFTRPWDSCMTFGPGERPNRLPALAWATAHPELGWVSVSDRGDVNPQGFRDPHDFDALAPAAGRKRLLVLGDSFMWGAGIGAEETVPALLQNTLGPRWDVFNVSVPGWGELLDAVHRSGVATHDFYRSDGHLRVAGARVVAARLAPHVQRAAARNER